MAHTSTADIRKLAITMFRNIKKDKLKHNIFAVCTEFLEQRNWPMGVIAFDLALDKCKFPIMFTLRKQVKSDYL